MNAAGDGSSIYLLNIAPDGNSVSVIQTGPFIIPGAGITLAVPYTGGFRKIQGTALIMWASANNLPEIYHVELLGSHTLSPVSALTSYSTSSIPFSIATDVRGVMEGTNLKYILVAYRTFAALPGNSVNARIRVYRNQAVTAPVNTLLNTIGMYCPVSLSNPLFVDGCTACAANNQALCDTCVSGQGKLRPLLTILTFI